MALASLPRESLPLRSIGKQRILFQSLLLVSANQVLIRFLGLILSRPHQP